MRPSGRGAVVVAVGLTVVLAGCGTDSPATPESGRDAVVPPTVPHAAPGLVTPTPTRSVTPSTSVPPVAAPTAPAAPSQRVAGDAVEGAAKPLGKRGAWRLTTYYTLVQRYHGGPLKAVRGCPNLHCTRGRTPLGRYPADFLKAIQTEGNGRITSGPQRGRFLNWSHSVGWWLDSSTRDSRGRPLRPWSSAAADRSVLRRGQRFRVLECGRIGRGGSTSRTLEKGVCERFRKSRWTVTDLFRPGHGGAYHVDLYIGEETGPNFKKNPVYTTLRGATLGTVP
jgi:hypothetical protein